MPVFDEYTVKAESYNSINTCKKAAQTLLGICAGVMADDELTEKEFMYLRHWMLEHSDVLSTEWPGSFLIRKMEHILEDGIISTEELTYFQDILKDLIGGTLVDVGSTRNNATTLPLNPEAEIIFPGKQFCFTGKFLYGTRAKCQEITQKLGGIASDTVKKDLDYLVIGIVGSDAWINTSYGRKIQKAVEQQQKGLSTLIINEEMWCGSLN